MTSLTRILVLGSIAYALAACSGIAFDDDDSAPPRCSVEWSIAPVEGSVVVDLFASAGGDGSRLEPLQTIEEGLDLARTRGDRFLLIAPGTYVGSLSLGPDDDGLALVGCGSETILDAEGAVGIDVSGADGVLLRDLVIENANTGVRIGAGAGAATPVQVNSVDVEDATRLGISVTGTGTRASLSDVNIRGVDVDPAGDALGYGLLAWGISELVAEDVVVRDATRSGVCISDVADFTVRRATVEGTTQFNGLLGRGVQVQAGSSGLLESVTVTGASDAGIFVLEPAGVVVLNSTVTDTLEANIEGAEGRSGVGLAATSGVLVEPAPAPMLLEVRESTFGANARLGVLLEGFGLDATLSDVVLSDNIIPDESTFPVDAPLFQTGATVTVQAGEPAVELTGDELQTLFRGPLPVN
ncbi:MAG: right-handed parallel beta-helix repeat-containing protein [Proteobacteria bacterium]|nr:right-handed parallel beta-helix repeat-containing protein [Pseudomonadota bacterium]